MAVVVVMVAAVGAAVACMVDIGAGAGVAGVLPAGVGAPAAAAAASIDGGPCSSWYGNSARKKRDCTRHPDSDLNLDLVDSMPTGSAFLVVIAAGLSLWLSVLR